MLCKLPGYSRLKYMQTRRYKNTYVWGLTNSVWNIHTPLAVLHNYQRDDQRLHLIFNARGPMGSDAFDKRVHQNKQRKLSAGFFM